MRTAHGNHFASESPEEDSLFRKALRRLVYKIAFSVCCTFCPLYPNMSNSPVYTDDLEDDILLCLQDPEVKNSELESAETSMALTLSTMDLPSVKLDGGDRQPCRGGQTSQESFITQPLSRIRVFRVWASCELNGPNSSAYGPGFHTNRWRWGATLPWRKNQAGVVHPPTLQCVRSDITPCFMLTRGPDCASHDYFANGSHQCHCQCNHFWLLSHSLLKLCRILMCAPNSSSVESRAFLDSGCSASFEYEQLS